MWQPSIVEADTGDDVLTRGHGDRVARDRILAVYVPTET